MFPISYNHLMSVLHLQLYDKAAVCLTDMECHRTQSKYDYALNFKIYILKFVNFYSSLIYIAFFKSKFTGYPGDYNTLFGARQEEVFVNAYRHVQACIPHTQA